MATVKSPQVCLACLFGFFSVYVWRLPKSNKNHRANKRSLEVAYDGHDKTFYHNLSADCTFFFSLLFFFWKTVLWKAEILEISRENLERMWFQRSHCVTRQHVIEVLCVLKQCDRPSLVWEMSERVTSLSRTSGSFALPDMSQTIPTHQGIPNTKIQPSSLLDSEWAVSRNLCLLL